MLLLGKKNFSVVAAETKIKNRATQERSASLNVQEEVFSKDDILEKKFFQLFFNYLVRTGST